MSFTKNKRDAVKHYILEQIEEGNNNVVSKTTNAFDMTSTSVYRYIKEMNKEGILYRIGHSYYLNEKIEKLDYITSQVGDEMDIVSDVLDKFISDCPDNIRRIWTYCLSEMINNIIDHSSSDKFSIIVRQTYMSKSFCLIDNGVGIFNKIKNYYRMSTIEDAIEELFKGKLTTDMKNHSGEGIFFSSKAVDVFAAFSDGKVFTRNKYDEWNVGLTDLLTNIAYDDTQPGTIIYMKLSNYSTRKLKDIFDQYASVDEGFYKTVIPIKNMFDDYPVSRSQAKRLVRRLENFKEVELDFTGVSEMGQGFAHELFIVFGKSHPNIKLTVVNDNDNVKKMIGHVLNTKL